MKQIEIQILLLLVHRRRFLDSDTSHLLPYVGTKTVITIQYASAKGEDIQNRKSNDFSH